MTNLLRRSGSQAPSDSRQSYCEEETTLGTRHLCLISGSLHPDLVSHHLLGGFRRLCHRRQYPGHSPFSRISDICSPRTDFFAISDQQPCLAGQFYVCFLGEFEPGTLIRFILQSIEAEFRETIFHHTPGGNFICSSFRFHNHFLVPGISGRSLHLKLILHSPPDSPPSEMVRFKGTRPWHSLAFFHPVCLYLGS